MGKIILFVDALEPREIGGTRFQETQSGLVESGYPKVTPKVTSEVYSGLSPSENGMGRVHSMKGDTPHRPHAPCIQEKLEAAGYNVISLHMPYCLPLQLQSQAWISTAMQQQAGGNHPLAQLCQQPPAGGDMLDPETDNDAVWNAKTDDLYAKSSSMMNAIKAGNFDVAFLAIRTPDQYTHFQWHEDYRRRLLEDIAYEVKRWEVNHDVLWWSDHGSEEKKDTFRVNKWLMDKGYLDLEIDMDFNHRFTDEMKSMNPQAQQGRDIENQIAVQSPGVEMKEGTQALSMDPYDSCIDIIDDDLNPDDLKADLMDTGMYRGVERAEDAWGSGQFIEQCPDLVTLRADNVLVTGNVHPDPIGMGFYRSGVHSAYGAWGTTNSDFTRQGDVRPRELHDIIWQFVTGKSQIGQHVEQQLDIMNQQFEQALNQREDNNEASAIR